MKFQGKVLNNKNKNLVSTTCLIIVFSITRRTLTLIFFLPWRRNHKVRFSHYFKPSNYFCKFIVSNGNKVVGIPGNKIYLYHQQTAKIESSYRLIGKEDRSRVRLSATDYADFSGFFLDRAVMESFFCKTQYIEIPCVLSQYLTIIPRTRMGSESRAHEAEGRMDYLLRGQEGEGNYCF